MMKKTLILAAAVAAMAACTKTQTVYDDTAEINFSPVNYSATKANVPGPVESTAYPVYENFKVFSLFTSSEPGVDLTTANNLQPYFSNATFTKQDYVHWAGTTPYYWPKTGSLFFSGYSPAEMIMTGTPTIDFTYEDVDTYGTKLTIPGFTQGNYEYTDGTAAPTNYSMVDLMYFDIWPDTKSVNNVEGGHPVLFRHALSWLTFNFDIDNGGLEKLFTVTKVILKNVNTCATFTSGKAATWANHTSTNNIVLFDNTKHDSKGGNVLTNVNDAKFKIDDVLVIPQEIPGYTDETTLEIYYTQKASAGSPEISHVESFRLTGGTGTTDLDKWLINRHYTYNLTFTATQIIINPSVENWIPVPEDGGATEIE